MNSLILEIWVGKTLNPWKITGTNNKKNQFANTYKTTGHWVITPITLWKNKLLDESNFLSSQRDRHGGCGGGSKVPTLTYKNLEFCVLLCRRKCRKEPSRVAGKQLSAKQLGNLNSMCSKVTFPSSVSAVHLLLSTPPSGFFSHLSAPQFPYL